VVRTFLGASLLLGTIFVVVILWQSQFAQTVTVPVPTQSTLEPPSQFERESLVQVDGHISIAAIQEAMNRDVPGSFEGNHDDVTDALKDDTLRWTINRENFSVSNTGERIGITIKGAGTANLTGKLVFAESSATVDYRLTASGSSLPRLQSDWTLEPQAQIKVQLDNANINLLGIDIDVSRFLQAGIDNEVKKQQDRLLENLRKDPQLRVEVEKSWRSLFTVQKLLDAPVTWLVVQPIEVLAVNPVVRENEVFLRLGIRTRVRVQVQSNPPLNPPTVLPNLTILDTLESGSTVFLPVRVDFDEVNRVFDAQVSGQTFQASGVDVTVKHLELSGSDDKVFLKAQLEASKPGLPGKFSIDAFLNAKPAYDHTSKILSFKNLEYELGTRDVLSKVAVWMLQPTLVRTLQKALTIKMEPLEERAKQAAKAAFDQAQATLPQGVTVQADLNNVNLEDIGIVPGGLLAVFTTRGTITATLKNLKF
jgi:hypothetical protein